MRIPTPSSALLLSALAALLSLSTLSSASPTSLLPKRSDDSIADMQNSLCTTADQTTIPTPLNGCQCCNCYCIARAQEACSTCSKAGVKLLQELREHHLCMSNNPTELMHQDNTNDAIYDWEVLGKW
ncbi:hypothetical protein MMC17_007566 [Xylographa soralifera]|nr:hypothetical protein [Xylographa soralifera]